MSKLQLLVGRIECFFTSHKPRYNVGGREGERMQCVRCLKYIPYLIAWDDKGLPVTDWLGRIVPREKLKETK